MWDLPIPFLQSIQVYLLIFTLPPSLSVTSSLFPSHTSFKFSASNSCLLSNCLVNSGLLGPHGHCKRALTNRARDFYLQSCFTMWPTDHVCVTVSPWYHLIFNIITDNLSSDMKKADLVLLLDLSVTFKQSSAVCMHFELS